MTKENRAFLNSIPAKRGAFAHEFEHPHQTASYDAAALMRHMGPHHERWQQGIAALDSGSPRDGRWPSRAAKKACARAVLCPLQARLKKSLT